MPEYGTNTAPILTWSQPTQVWSAETPTLGELSQQVCLPPANEYLPKCLSVEIAFSAAPGTFEVDVMTTDTDNEAYYTKKAAITEVNAGNVARVELTGIVAKFVALQLVALENAVEVTAGICT